MKCAWRIFDKNAKNQINYIGFFQAFVRAKAIQGIISFDDKVSVLVNKFVKILESIGDYEECWSKLDKWNKGEVTFLQFKEQTLKYDFDAGELHDKGGRHGTATLHGSGKRGTAPMR